MKRLLLILILTMSLQSWTKADDISDFEIEGISIGDSLLDYFSEEEIKDNQKNYYNNDEIIPVYIIEDKFENYYGIQFHYKKNDKNYIIIGISGAIMFENNINNCKKKQNEIVKSITKMFPNASFFEGESPHGQDKTGKSMIYTKSFELKSGHEVSVDCYDWTKKMNYPDHLRVSLLTKDLINFVTTKAYK